MRDVTQALQPRPYIQANQNNTLFQFSRFLQPPPNPQLDYSASDSRTNWAADVHLISTYAFLSTDESKIFAANAQQFLIKEVYQYSFPNVTGSKKVKLDSLSMVANWMWVFQRSDANLRNEWSNYSNWPYNNVLPFDVVFASTAPNAVPLQLPGCPDLLPPAYITGDYSTGNQKDILQNWALLLDGKYRENTLDAGLFSYVEKYARSAGSSPSGLYCYNFCISTDPQYLQPSGAINMSKFTQIELEISTIYPTLDPNASFYTICDPNTGLPIGVNKTNWRIYNYTFDFTVMEERYNVLTFASGNCGLMYAR